MSDIDTLGNGSEISLTSIISGCLSKLLGNGCNKDKRILIRVLNSICIQSLLSNLTFKCSDELLTCLHISSETFVGSDNSSYRKHELI